jgi:putative Holliday junction resolvase
VLVDSHEKRPETEGGALAAPPPFRKASIDAPAHGREEGAVPLLALPDFQAALAPAGALMGLDPGAKRIGLAVSDATRLIASPLRIVTRSRAAADADAIFALYEARACIGLVVGLPLNMDGSSGPAAQAARAFARNLLAVRDTPLLLWDERLSTAAINRSLIAADTSRARRAAIVDKLAASYVLQGALDRLRQPPL